MKKVLLGICVIGSCMLVAQQAHMCTLASPQVVIDLPINTELFKTDKTCVSDDCQYVFERDSGGTWALVDTNLDSAYRRIGILSKQSLYISKDQFEPFIAFVGNVLYSEKFFTALDALFIGDQATLRDPFYKEVAQWLLQLPTNGIDANLRVSEFDSTVDAHALKSQKSFFSCSYSVVTASTGWMITRPAIRSYCHIEIEGATCPSLTLSHFAHARYQIGHFSWSGFPYLMIYVGICCLAAGAVGYLVYVVYKSKKQSGGARKKASRRN